MDFGMPTLVENRTLDDNVRLCKELGLQFVELNMNFPQYQIESLEQTATYREIMKREGIYFTIHLDENLNVADFNHAVANAYMDTVRRAIPKSGRTISESAWRIPMAFSTLRSGQ